MIIGATFDALAIRGLPITGEAGAIAAGVVAVILTVIAAWVINPESWCGWLLFGLNAGTGLTLVVLHEAAAIGFMLAHAMGAATLLLCGWLSVRLHAGISTISLVVVTSIGMVGLTIAALIGKAVVLLYLGVDMRY